METINELTEQEILNLTEDEIQNLIKLKKAEEGIKLISKPEEPEYLPVPEPDVEIYTCPVFDNNLVFYSYEDIIKILNEIETMKRDKVETAWGIDSSKEYIAENIDNSYKKWNSVTKKQVYSYEVYAKINDILKKNGVMKRKHEKMMEEYNKAIESGKSIEEEIYGRIIEVRDKYSELNSFIWMFKNEYLPLANEDEETAMRFLDKAYLLTDEQKEYIISNYKNS